MNLIEAADDVDASTRVENAKPFKASRNELNHGIVHLNTSQDVSEREMFSKCTKNIVTLSEAKQQQQHVALKGFNKKNQSIRK